jgi:hypothetical protein
MHRVLVLAICFVSLGSTSGAQPPAQRWYRGNTHTHTLNSDGDTPPGDVVRWYRENGYDFVVVTDHELITDVAPLNALYGVREKFLVVRGEEVTQLVSDPSHPDGRRQAHVVGINLTKAVTPLGERFVATGITMAQSYARNLGAIEAAGGLPQVNHPNWRWSVRPVDMMQLPDSTMFEVWNGHPGVNNLGGSDSTGAVALSTEALWDTLLTRGKLLWGVGSDDSHYFRPEKHDDPTAPRPGRAWVMVRADSLDPAALTRALHAGRFYSSTGIWLKDYVVQPTGIELVIQRGGLPGGDTRYLTRFIGRGGRVLAESAGLTARYRFGGNEGYVRVKIVDSNGHQAWTQPVPVGAR